MTEEAGKINVYTCSKGHRTAVQLRDAGVTPFIIGCKRKGCDQDARSEFYQLPLPLLAAAAENGVWWQFVRPSETEWQRYCDRRRADRPADFPIESFERALQSTKDDHIARGGLILLATDELDS